MIPAPLASPGAGTVERAKSICTCVVFVALGSTGQQLRHGGTHSFGGASQVLGTFFELRERNDLVMNLPNVLPRRGKGPLVAPSEAGTDFLPTRVAPPIFQLCPRKGHLLHASLSSVTASINCQQDLATEVQPLVQYSNGMKANSVPLSSEFSFAV